MGPRIYVLTVLAAVGLVLAGAGVVWACTPRASFIVTPNSGSAGQQITLVGRDFPALGPVVVVWEPSGEILATTRGSDFDVDAQVPEDAPPGTGYVRAFGFGAGVPHTEPFNNNPVAVIAEPFTVTGGGGSETVPLPAETYEKAAVAAGDAERNGTDAWHGAREKCGLFCQGRGAPVEAAGTHDHHVGGLSENWHGPGAARLNRLVEGVPEDPEEVREELVPGDTSPEALVPEAVLDELEAMREGGPEGAIPGEDAVPDSVLPEEEVPEDAEVPQDGVPQVEPPQVEAPDVDVSAGDVPEASLPEVDISDGSRDDSNPEGEEPQDARPPEGREQPSQSEAQGASRESSRPTRSASASKPEHSPGTQSQSSEEIRPSEPQPRDVGPTTPDEDSNAAPSSADSASPAQAPAEETAGDDNPVGSGEATVQQEPAQEESAEPGNADGEGEGSKAAARIRTGRPGPDARAEAEEPSVRSVAENLWSGFGSGEGLVSGANEPAKAAGDRTAQQLILGLGLLGVGLLVLLSGAFVALAHRRVLATASTRAGRDTPLAPPTSTGGAPGPDSR